MESDTGELIDVTFAVNAWGTPAGGKWPHFSLRLDGVEIGQAAVESATLSRYTFTAKVPAGSAHNLQLHYDNDTKIGTEDRNLFVKSFEVNGNTILAIDNSVRYDTGAVDGLNVISGQTELLWGGALNVPLPADLFPLTADPAGTLPPTMTTKITVNAWGNTVAGQAPHFKLLVDGKVVGDAWVNTNNSSSPGSYTFTANVDPNEAHRIQVWYDNDSTVNGVDRNLFVKSIVVDGQTFAATSQFASYDKGPVDGKFIVAGQEGLFWGGALNFGLGEEYFGGAYVPPPPPPPPPVTETVGIVVNAWGQSAGGIAPHFKVLVDGKVIGDAKATSGTVTPYSFETVLDPTKAHKVQVWYDNDSWANGQDRNLFVKSVTINGHTVPVTDGMVTYDKGAFDGKDVVKGQEGLFWGGALTFNAPVHLFDETAPPPPKPPTGPAFYVATNGKDTWSGKLAQPNADGTDGPFASMERARDAMRSSDIDTTYVREGKYNLTKTLELTSLDNGHNFKNYPGEKAVFSGGEVVKGFVNEGNGIYSAKLATPSYLDLFVGGERQTLASKAAFVEGDITSGWYFADASTGDARFGVRFHTGDIRASDVNANTLIQLMDAERLGDHLTSISSISDSSRAVTLKNGASLAFAEGTTYKLLNNAAFVDQAGEFAWRAGDGRLVYKPENAATFEASGVEVARLGTLIRLNGSSNVTIDGLTFTNTTTDGNALELIKASNNKISDNDFVNVGNAIRLSSGSSYNKIAHNDLDHLARNGIELEGRSNNNAIYANEISNIGEVRKAVSGISGTGVDNNLISNNDIDHSARYGISLKDFGGTTNTVNRNNIIQYNKVTHTGLETADGGAIEILGRSGLDTGNIIQGNRVQDANGIATNANDQWVLNHKGFGIYLDDLAGGVTVRNNFIKDTDWASVHIHGGDNNTVTGNFSVISTNQEEFIRIGWQPVHGDAGNPRNNTVTGNLVEAASPLDDYMELLTAGTFTLDRNFVHNLPTYGDRDISGKPMFTNAYYGDYSLQPGSPVLAAGIQDLAWSKMGIVGFSATDGMPVFWDAV